MVHHSPTETQVVGLGQACVDYLGRTPSYPPEDGKVELEDLFVRCGGPASTALVTLSRLGVPVSFLGSISDDPFGSKIRENLLKESVDITHLKITPGLTSQFAFIAVTRETGSRTIFWHRGTAPHLRKEDVDLKPFPRARVLHADSLMIEAALEASRQAKDLGLTVVMDAGTWREGSRELLARVDVLIASETFALPLVGPGKGPQEMLHALEQLCPGQVVITLGPRGSIGMGEKGLIRQGPFSVVAVDSTGAGDVYHGAYIYGLLQGWGMAQCMRFAGATAALACREIGAQTGIPDLKTVEEFIASQTPP